MIAILLRATGIWLAIFVVAIINGLFREMVLMALVGAAYALPLSGLTLSALVLAVSWLSITLFDLLDEKTYFVIGFFWVLLTLLVEFLFGHFVLGKSWQEIAQVFNLQGGNLFVVVLLVTLLAPWAAAKSRGLL